MNFLSIPVVKLESPQPVLSTTMLCDIYSLDEIDNIYGKDKKVKKKMRRILSWRRRKRLVLTQDRQLRSLNKAQLESDSKRRETFR